MSKLLPMGWPPLITHANAPRYMIWRDRTLTLGAWLLMLWFMRQGLALMWSELVEWWYDLPHQEPEPHWDVWWLRLQPFVVAISLLALWLLGWGLLSRRRVLRQEWGPPPPPLSLTEHAAEAGVEAAQLAEWRRLKIAVVNIDDMGLISVESQKEASLVS